MTYCYDHCGYPATNVDPLRETDIEPSTYQSGQMQNWTEEG